MKWIKSARVNPNDKERGYRVVDSFNDLGIVEYDQGMFKFKVGDIVYIYGGAPEQRIMAKCMVVKTDKYELTIDDMDYLYHPEEHTRVKYPIEIFEPAMELEMICEYEPCKELSREALEKHGVRGSIRSPRHVNGKLEEYLSSVDGKHIRRFYSGAQKKRVKKVNCYEKVMSFPCGDTYDISCKWGVHAHPIKRGQPPRNRSTRCVILRAHAGMTETLYEIENTVDVNPLEIESARSELDDKSYRRLIKYHADRMDMGYGYLQGFVFRFYILRAIHEFRPKIHWKRNALNVEYVDLDELSLPKSVLERIGIAKAQSEIKSSNKPLDDGTPEEDRIRHARRMTDEQLKAAAKKKEKKKTIQRETKVKQSVRDPYIVEYTKRKANGRCQLCNKPAPFRDKEGNPYLESHHIVWLAQGGPDTLENSVALCPNCHRKMHVVNDKRDIKKLLSKAKRNSK